MERGQRAPLRAQCRRDCRARTSAPSRRSHPAPSVAVRASPTRPGRWPVVSNDRPGAYQVRLAPISREGGGPVEAVHMAKASGGIAVVRERRKPSWGGCWRSGTRISFVSSGSQPPPGHRAASVHLLERARRVDRRCGVRDPRDRASCPRRPRQDHGAAPSCHVPQIRQTKVQRQRRGRRRSDAASTSGSLDRRTTCGADPLYVKELPCRRSSQRLQPPHPDR
jgi:hypothetical protein